MQNVILSNWRNTPASSHHISISPQNQIYLVMIRGGAKGSSAATLETGITRATSAKVVKSDNISPTK